MILKPRIKINIIDLAKKNPIKYLLKTYGNFFIEKEGYILALREGLEEII